MIFILADPERSGPLLLRGLESTQRRAELLELSSVLRPVARPLRGDGTVVMGLRLSKQVADRP